VIFGRFLRAPTRQALFICIALFLYFVLLTFHLPKEFENEPGAGVFGGVRLHYIPSFGLNLSRGVPGLNQTSHLLDNFWKSMAYGQHGLIDFLPWYLISGVYDLVGIPLSPQWFLIAQAFLLVVGILIASRSLKLLFQLENLRGAYLAVAFILYLPFGRSFYIFPFNFILESLLFHETVSRSYMSSAPRKLFFLMLVGINAMCANILVIPFYFLLFLYLEGREQKTQTFRRSMYFFIPALLALALHVYVYIRLGESKLGLIGHGLGTFRAMVSQSTSSTGPVLAILMKLWNTFGGFYSKPGFYPFFNLTLWLGYVLAIRSETSRRPLYLIPFLYAFCFQLIEPKIAIVGISFCYALGIQYIWNFLLNWASPERRRYIFLFLLVTYGLAINTPLIKRKFIPSHESAIKGVGYLLRQTLAPQEKILSMMPVAVNILGEYYFGRTYFRSPIFGKEIYTLQDTQSPRDTSMPRFAHAIVRLTTPQELSEVLSPLSPFFDRGLYETGRVQVAEGDYWVVLSTKKRLEPPLILTIEEAGKLFDSTFANLRDLFQHHHVGLASIWGTI
jgi:hypothetical protein